MENVKETPSPWMRRTNENSCMHAHWDCFSGAAGDMMLAACLDAAGDESDALLLHVTYCLRQGLFPTAPPNEFDIQCRRVWRGSGSITALHISVHSRYGDVAAAVPAARTHPVGDHLSLASQDAHAHQHAHSHEHSHQHTHEHVHSHKSSRPSDEFNTHSHDHNDSRKVGATDGTSEAPMGPIRNLPAIRQMLLDASTEFIPDWVKDKATAAFTELALAEMSVHGAASIDDVHFHEVGAIDSIVDTVGTLLALYHLGVTTCSCSRLPVGDGMVSTAHGWLPVPAPATLRLLVGMPLTPGPMGRTGELVTPTAAALLRVLTGAPHAASSQMTHRPPPFTLRRVGVGAGTKDFVQHPNIVRLWLGDEVETTSSKDASNESNETVDSSPTATDPER